MTLIPLAAAAVLTAGLFAQPQQAKKQPQPFVPPDLANVAYGPHERNVFDLWKAKSAGPTPLVIHIHGGGFGMGDKSQVSRMILEGCLKNGISVASINYRYSTQAPYPAPMADSARAVQFLRLHAAEYNLNPKAFAATGGSAGAGISLWIGFHDDMADLKSGDPVLRQSTRLSSMFVTAAQTTYDPRTIATLIGEKTARHNALRLLFDVKSGVDPLEAADRFKAYEDGSPITHLSAGDPPVFLYYPHSNTPLPPENNDIGIHHPKFGYFLKERMDKLGIECTVKVKEDYEQKQTQYSLDVMNFFLKHFLN